MTEEQAKFVKKLRVEHECTWRALDVHYTEKFGTEEEKKKVTSKGGLFTYGGNQIDGMILQEKAEKILGEKFD